MVQGEATNLRPDIETELMLNYARFIKYSLSESNQVKLIIYIPEKIADFLVGISPECDRLDMSY